MEHAKYAFPRFVLGIAALILVGACAQAPTKSSGRVLSGDEIRELLTYNSEETTTADGGIWRAYHPNAETEIGTYTHPDGTTIGNRSRKIYRDDSVCAEWALNDWGTRCYELRQHGDKITFRNVNVASEHGEIRVLPGNPFDF